MVCMQNDENSNFAWQLPPTRVLAVYSRVSSFLNKMALKVHGKTSANTCFSFSRNPCLKKDYIRGKKSNFKKNIVFWDICVNYDKINMCSGPDSTTTSTLFLSTTKPKMLRVERGLSAHIYNSSSVLTCNCSLDQIYS